MSSKRNIVLLALAIGAFFTAPIASAHHSFSIYDIDNKIERTGVLTKYRIVSPHIMMEVEVLRPDGETETWEIETMQPQRWDREGKDREWVAVGDDVTIFGWPRRDGKDVMALSAIVGKKGKMTITEEIRQGSAASGRSSETIKREVKLEPLPVEEVAVPEVAAPDVAAPDVAAPDVAIPAIPAVAAPGAAASDVQLEDATSEAATLTEKIEEKVEEVMADKLP